MLEVVAALIVRDDKYLICRRAAHKSNGGLWEFPGGKIEAGESRKQARIRECAEELAVQQQVGGLLLQTQHSYPHTEISLSLYACTVAIGEPQALKHQEIRWVSLTEMPAFEFSPADRYFVEQLQK
jgi:8-oxo-dGTP diphosphatase